MNVFPRLLWKVAMGAAVAALILALWFRGEKYAEQAEVSQTLLKGAIAIGNANADAARFHVNLSRKVNAVEAVAAVRKQQLRAHADTIRKAINDAPMDDDGPLAPVLRDQLDRLPDLSAASSNRNPAVAAAAGVAAAAE